MENISKNRLSITTYHVNYRQLVDIALHSAHTHTHTRVERVMHGARAKAHTRLNSPGLMCGYVQQQLKLFVS